MVFWLQEFDQETEDSCEEVGLAKPFPSLRISLAKRFFFFKKYAI
jgi:hypothetical protein